MDVYGRAGIYNQGPWASRLTAMTISQRQETLLLLEKKMMQKTRHFLKANRNTSEFLRSKGILGIKPLFLGLVYAPFRTALILSVLFYLHRISPLVRRASGSHEE